MPFVSPTSETALKNRNPTFFFGTKHQKQMHMFKHTRRGSGHEFGMSPHVLHFKHFLVLVTHMVWVDFRAGFYL